MATILAIGELANGVPTRLTLEIATLARRLADASGTTARLLLAGAGANRAAEGAAAYGPDVLAAELDAGEAPAAAVITAQALAVIAELRPDWVLVGASPDGRDVAGALVGLTDLPILVNSAGVQAGEAGLEAQMGTFGGRLVTRSAAVGGRGIVLVRPASVVAEVAPSRGSVEALAPAAIPATPAVRVVDRVVQAGDAASIEEARVVVGAGRGVGSPEGLGVVAQLADALGGAVGATRAIVDAGWIGYGQQIGQTGKVIKPELYIACGISGAIQHKVGVQTAGTIVAINKDPDAPITEFADLVVVGDLFEVVPLLAEAIRARRG